MLKYRIDTPTKTKSDLTDLIIDNINVNLLNYFV